MKYFVGVEYFGTNPPGNPYEAKIVDTIQEVIIEVCQLLKEPIDPEAGQIIIQTRGE